MGYANGFLVLVWFHLVPLTSLLPASQVFVVSVHSLMAFYPFIPQHGLALVEPPIFIKRQIHVRLRHFHLGVRFSLHITNSALF